MKDLKDNTVSSKQVLMTDNFWNSDETAVEGEPKYAVNIRDKPKGYRLEVSAPGFKKKDFRISTDDGVLILSAESRREENDEKGNYIRKEFSHSSFTGSFQLPQNVLEDHISAKYLNGLFTVDLKKSDKGVSLKKRQIKIH